MEGQDEDARIKEAFLDMLDQACGQWEPAVYARDPDGRTTQLIKARKFLGYDSCCLSAYESALFLAVEFEWIKQEEVLR